MKTAFIYCLREPDTGAVRYIGKTTRPPRRGYEHLYYLEATTHKICWIKALLAKGLSPKLTVLKEVPALEWKDWERRYIRCARDLGFDLTNGTDGGDGFGSGQEHPNFGKAPSLESRQKQSELMSGDKNPMFGKKGKNHPAFGYVYSEEQCKKRSLARKGKRLGPPCSLESRQKMSAARKGKKLGPFTPEHCLALGRSKLGKKTSKNTSGFAGIFWSKRYSKWEAKPVKNTYIGRFKKIEDAVFARALAISIYGA